VSAHDRLGAHVRDELGIEQGRWPAAASGVDLCRELCLLLASSHRGPSAGPRVLAHSVIAALSLGCLAGLGALGGYLGGAPKVRAAFGSPSAEVWRWA